MNYVYQEEDVISNTLHRHESPVCNTDRIEIIDHADKYSLFAVNKPSSIPIHPSGRFRYNSLKWILYHQVNGGFDKYGTKTDILVHTVNRLDTVVSGLCLMVTDKNQIAHLQNRFAANQIQKVYVAKVRGNFPDFKVTVNASIGVLPQRSKIERKDGSEDALLEQASYIKYGVINSENSRYAITEFVKRSFDGKYSLIECYPLTGRTHQIRIHLEHIGYPIGNDVKYGGAYIDDTEENEIKPYVVTRREDVDILKNMIERNEDESCVECKMIKKQIDGEIDSPFDSTKQIWLHALSYKCDIDGWYFETALPTWAKC